MNLRKRTGAGEDRKNCVTSVTKFKKNSSAKLHPAFNRSGFVEDQSTVRLSEDHKKLASNSPVMFFRHKLFCCPLLSAVLLTVIALTMFAIRHSDWLVSEKSASLPPYDSQY